MKIRSIAALVAVTATILIGSPAPANAWSQPYGGCKEAWQAPHSKGAAECRSHGWTVTKRLVVTPHKRVVFDRLPACRYEDGSGQRSACTWNLHPSTSPDGNGVGMAYWIDRRDRTHYVWTNEMCIASVSNPASSGARQCRRAGWIIERDTYPASTETTPWTYATSYLVVSPTGHVYIDTLNQLGDVR